MRCGPSPQRSRVLHRGLLWRGSRTLPGVAGLLARARSRDLTSIPAALVFKLWIYCSNNFYLSVFWGEGGKR